MSNFNFGYTVGPYEIQRKLGDGGYGTAYLAINKKTGKKVALKLRDSFEDDPEEVRRFLHECEVLAKISHPNIINCNKAGFVDGFLYLSLDYIDGETLFDYIIESGPIPYKEATSYILSIADAIMTLNAKHVVHRDIKAENIILSKTGEIKLIDFGLALSPALGFDENPDDVHGTPKYLAPEYIANGNQTDLYAGVYDIYSLGVLYHFLITGNYTFEGKQYSVISKHLNEDPSRIPNVPESVNTLYLWMLEKDPIDRATPIDVIELADSIIHT